MSKLDKKKRDITALHMYAIPRHDAESPTKQWWLGPFLAPSDDVALDAMKELAASAPSLQKSYVYHIGVYDCETGRVMSNEPRRIACNRKKVFKKTKEVKNV